MKSKLLALFTTLISYSAFSADPSVADIRNGNIFGGAINGTGFVVEVTKDSSIIATNYHVCALNYRAQINRKAKPKTGFITAKFSTGPKLTGKIIKTSIKYDLCLVQIKERRPTKTLAESPKLAPQETLEIIASPSRKNVKLAFVGKDSMSDVWSKGHADSWVAKGYAENGMSGSPVVNSKGLVVGIVWGNIKSTKSTVFVHAMTLKRFIKKEQ